MGGNRGAAPPTLSLSTRWRRAVGLTPTLLPTAKCYRHPPNRRQGASGPIWTSGVKRSFAGPDGIRRPDRPALGLITTPTGVTRIPISGL